jgi:signal transduction histidine kinase
VERWPLNAHPDSASGSVLLTVADSGPGVPDDQKDRIFERFFQAEAGRNVRGRGVGLGLTICREIAAAHGGAIWVSDNPGRGSTFQVLLPGALQVSREAAFATIAPGNEQHEIHES